MCEHLDRPNRTEEQSNMMCLSKFCFMKTKKSIHMLLKQNRISNLTLHRLRLSFVQLHFNFKMLNYDKTSKKEKNLIYKRVASPPV